MNSPVWGEDQGLEAETMLEDDSKTRDLLRISRRCVMVGGFSAVLFSLQSCGGVTGSGLPLAGVMPAVSTVPVGGQVALSTFGAHLGGSCVWSTSNSAILANLGEGKYRGTNPGLAIAVANCADTASISASVRVIAATPAPIVITAGGVYSGTWASDDPDIPAVTIHTDQAVTLLNAGISSRGDLISVSGVTRGADVTLQNVTGIALDPGVAGRQRGTFITAQNISALRVTHCSMYGVSYGIRVLSSTVTTLNLAQNLARELEDRGSDGHGGLQTSRPSLGHFIFLNGVLAPDGAEIAWNQVVDTIGNSSTEDVINVYKSQGSPTATIHVHDNYLEGYSSTTTPSYTGTGAISDGDSHQPVTAFVTFENNQMVHTAGSGVEIAGGHDILARNNRVVSCGMDAGGKWYAMPYVNAVVFWNYYGAPEFNNNVVTGMHGGVVRPDAQGKPMIADLYVRTPDLNESDESSGNNFSDPCFVNGNLNLQAEEDERALWRTKLAAASMAPGDQHQP